MSRKRKQPQKYSNSPHNTPENKLIRSIPVKRPDVDIHGLEHSVYPLYKIKEKCYYFFFKDKIFRGIVGTCILNFSHGGEHEP